MSTDNIRYRVDIPAYIVVYLDNNLSIVEHELDTETTYLYSTDGMPSVKDYWDPNEEGGRLILDIREALDVHNNALNYARGLHILNGKQVSEGKIAVSNGEPF